MRAAAQDGNSFEPREGAYIRLSDSKGLSPQCLFIMTAASSAMVGNKPVHCTGLMPGVSLSVHVRRPVSQELETFTASLWTHFQPYIGAWIENAEQLPCLTVAIDGASIALGLDRHITLDKGVMQIEAVPGWAGSANAAAGPA
jgi:hypothetical protein